MFSDVYAKYHLARYDADVGHFQSEVLAKKKVGIKAVNLTKTTFDEEVIEGLKHNMYSFIYMVGQFTSKYLQSTH